MKKALAVLVIMMVALVSVFADGTITLRNKVEGTDSSIAVYYGIDADHATALNTDRDAENIDLAGGSRYFDVRLSGNKAVDQDHTVTFTVTPFELYNENYTEKKVPNNGTYQVPVKFSVTPVAGNLGTYATASYSGDTLNVTYKAYSNIKDHIVATASLSWANTANDLVAGNYQSTVTVTIDGK